MLSNDTKINVVSLNKTYTIGELGIQAEFMQDLEVAVKNIIGNQLVNMESEHFVAKPVNIWCVEMIDLVKSENPKFEGYFLEPTKDIMKFIDVKFGKDSQKAIGYIKRKANKNQALSDVETFEVLEQAFNDLNKE